MSSELLIGQIAQPNILSCPQTISISEAARRMNEARCSSILVMDEAGRVEGIWTERDALAVDFSDPASFDRPIAEVMNSPVKTLHHQCTLGEATMRFREEGVRHFLVVDDAHEPLGVVTQTDVIHNQGAEYFVLLREVKTIVKSAYSVISGDLSLSEAARKMRELRLDALVVEGQDGTLGIITERDVLRYVSDRKSHNDVWEVASKPLITIPANSSLYHARNIFNENRIRHLGVTSQNGSLYGVIAYADILASIEHAYVRELQGVLKERDETLSLSNRHLRLAEKVFETTFEGIMVTNADSEIESVNPAFAKITGYELREVVGKKPDILSSGRHAPEFYRKMKSALAENGCWQGEIWNRRKNGEVYPEWLSISTVKSKEGGVSNYVAIFSDITERKASEEHVRFLAHHDALTGLPNRMLMMERLEHALAHAHRHGLMLAVMFLDLDRFKNINDSLGHALGDQLLKTVAQRLTESVREDDTAARLGGDEFIIILEAVSTPEDVVGIAQKLVDSLAQPVMLGRQETVVSSSIGISIYPGDGESADALIKHADIAMYRAKEQGRNNYQFYTADMNIRALERLTMEGSLRHALERNEFKLYYQPQVDLRTRCITGMEALLRWQHPDLGLVQPSRFIPIAEETGLIVAIGEWALRAACFQNKAWQDAGLQRVLVAVNLSARQFKQPNLVNVVSQALADSGLEPCYLELEITESIAMEHAEETITRLKELKAMGVAISMDDFGTGHSSLSYLKRFPIDTLKIDQSFVQDVLFDSQDAAIAAAITTLARSLKMKVVTEGVETQEQVGFLREHDRDEVQGYYFSHPLPADAFAELLRNKQPFG